MGYLIKPIHMSEETKENMRRHAIEASLKKMMKVEKCPNCGQENPPLTLRLVDPQKYEDPDNIPNNRVYALICLECGNTIGKFTVDNTTTAVKALRSEMDRLYGESFTLPIL